MTLNFHVPESKNDVAALARKKMPEICAALPAGTDRQSFAAQVMAELNAFDVSGVPEIYSHTGAVSAFNAARIGLPPGATNGYCYFVPRFGSKKQCTQQIQLELGFRGLLELSYKNDFLRQVTCDVVLDGEEFAYGTNSDGDYIEHPKEVTRRPDKDKVVAAYCLAHFKSGGRTLTVLTRSELDEIEPKYGADFTWGHRLYYCEMAKKSAIKRSSKGWRRTAEMSIAVQLDDQLETSQPQDAPEGLDVTTQTAIDLDSLTDGE